MTYLNVFELSKKKDSWDAREETRFSNAKVTETNGGSAVKREAFHSSTSCQDSRGSFQNRHRRREYITCDIFTSLCRVYVRYTVRDPSASAIESYLQRTSERLYTTLLIGYWNFRYKGPLTNRLEAAFTRLITPATLINQIARGARRIQSSRTNLFIPSIDSAQSG